MNKYKVINFRKKNPRLGYIVESESLTYVQCERDLEVLDDD